MVGVPVQPEPLAYLDHAATTPLRAEARAAMLPWLGEAFGNPSGAHGVARAARQAIDEARDTIAGVLGCAPNEVVFTGGGTEADNLAVLGVVAARPGPVVASAIEHHAVLEPVAEVGGRLAPVDERGIVDLSALATLLEEHPDTTLVSVMTANNEVGSVQPLAEIAKVVRRRAPEAVLHTDAVQGAAWLDIATVAADAQLVSVSAHKVGGPQGVGVLIHRRGTPLQARQLGGGQERELRSGTHNVAGIVGMAAALAVNLDRRDEEWPRVAALRDRLAAGLIAALPGTTVNGDEAHKLINNCHVTFPGVESESLLLLLDREGLCAAAGSSCASGAMDLSHVLAAMGMPRDRARASLRLTFGWSSTDAEVDEALAVIPAAVTQLRPLAARRLAAGS